MVETTKEERVGESASRIEGELKTNTSVQLLVAPNVLETIARETVPYVSDDLETGGILAGRWLDDRTILIIAATGAGPKADHQRLTFAIDIDYANERLNELRDGYRGVDYVGEWHKHPNTYPRPSGGDLHMAKQLLTDPNYPDRLVNPIVIFANGKVTVNFFYLDKGQDEFNKLTPQVIGYADVENFLNLPVNASAARAQASRLSRKSAAWWKTSEGKSRLIQECELLEDNGFEVIENDKLDESTWRIKAAAHNGRQPELFEFQCYGNYPTSRPGFAAYTTNGTPFALARSGTLSNWQAGNFLYEVCREVQKEAGSKAWRTRLWIIGAVALVAVFVLVGIILASINGNASVNRDATARANENEAFARGVAATATARSLAFASANNNSTRAALYAQNTATSMTQMAEQNRLNVEATRVAETSAALDAIAQGRPVNTPTSLNQGTARPSRPTNELFTLMVREVTKPEFDERVKGDKQGLTPFRLMAVLESPEIAAASVKIHFPGYNQSTSSDPNFPNLAFNYSAGFGCQEGQTCNISIVNTQDEAVSTSVAIENFDPTDKYYIFIIGKK